MQAKDISDAEFIGAVAQAAALRGFDGATRWDVAMVLGGLSQNVAALGLCTFTGSDQGDGLTVSPVPGFPEKVILAKAKKHIRRGLIEGCACGCRGEFSLTQSGRELLAI